MDLLSEETWKFINTFAPWLSALGTLLAVLVSLNLARRDRKIRLEISAGHRIVVTPGVPAPYPEYLSINIVNVGHREAQITNIGWKVGILKKQYAVQTTISDGISSPIPVRLKDGDEAKYLIPLNEQTKWLENFGKDMLSPFPRIRAHFVKVQVFTSIGRTFESHIEKNLRVRLVKAATAKERS